MSNNFKIPNNITKILARLDSPCQYLLENAKKIFDKTHGTSQFHPYSHYLINILMK